MKPKPASKRLSRRAFLEAGATSAAWISLASAKAQSDATRSPAAHSVAGRQGYGRTDPALLRYRELHRFACGRDDTRRLAFGPDGRLWVAAGSFLCGFNERGNPVAELALSAPARCLAISPDHEFYVGFRDHLEVLEAQGKRRAVWDLPKQKTWFTSLAWTATALFAADSGNRWIWKLDATGKVLGRIGEKNAEREIPGFVLPSPFLDVEVHPDGLLRVNNAGRHRVEAYTLEGDLEFSWGKPTMGIEGFCGCCNPVALAMLSDGRIVTCEKGLPRVKIYSAKGEFEGVVAGVESFAQNARVGAGEAPGDGVKASLDAVVDGQGRIWVLDTVTAEVHIFEPKASA